MASIKIKFQTRIVGNRQIKDRNLKSIWLSELDDYVLKIEKSLRSGITYVYFNAKEMYLTSNNNIFGHTNRIIIWFLYYEMVLCEPDDKMF